VKVAGIGVNHSPTWHYRHADDFDIVVYRTSLLKSTIRILWNSLDAKLKSSKSIVVLNVNIKKYCWFNSLFFMLCMTCTCRPIEDGLSGLVIVFL